MPKDRKLVYQDLNANALRKTVVWFFIINEMNLKLLTKNCQKTLKFNCKREQRLKIRLAFLNSWECDFWRHTEINFWSLYKA